MKVVSAEFPKGTKLGSLIVLGPSKKRYHVRCRCSCGKIIEPYISNLRLKKTTSCGSHRSSTRSITVNIVKGDSQHSLYSMWRGIINRCYNPSQPHYARYGGRGISVCDRWLTFRNFVADVGPRKNGYSLDRVDNNQGYNPDNCRWATYTEQASNRRRSENSRLLFFSGKLLSVSEWARKTGISNVTLTKRLNAGWSVSKALTASVGPSGPKRFNT